MQKSSTRRTVWYGVAVAILCITTSQTRSQTQSSEAESHSVPLVDCHVHLWDLERKDGVSWIAKDNRTLLRSILPEHHQPIARANQVRAVVVVQAGQSLDDNQWNLDVTADNPDLYRGVVGNLSRVIGTDAFGPLFETLCKDPRYVGYRLSGRTKAAFTEEFFRDLKLTAEKGRTVDFLASEYSLSDISEIATRVPDLKIMLDHFGNVRLDDKPLTAKFVEDLRATARHKNVYCKFSALYGRVSKQPAPRDLDFYRPLLDLAWDCFGEDRLVFGSDWPVTETTGDYASVLRLTRSYFASRERRTFEKVFYKNAVTFYGLKGLE